MKTRFPYECPGIRRIDLSPADVLTASQADENEGEWDVREEKQTTGGTET